MKKSNTKFQYKRYSEHAILIQGPSKIDETLLENLLFYKKSIEKFYGKLIIEVILSYNSLLIYYASTIENVYDEVLTLKSLFSDEFENQASKKRLWKVPVCYSNSLAPELSSFAVNKSMEIDEVISLHTTPLYTVYFIGFLPGFLYLGGLDEKLFAPRKSTPSQKLEHGSVAIGGNQTGIYPCDSPGGWHVIGKTPVRFFDINADNCCFASPGDKIQFISITEEQYNDIGLLVNTSNSIPESKIL
ncbi:5-oxoprolinase subunit PxpB [Aquimarina sp. BL5]|uniref:5-oxoprolinase subunit PxpB n=1 Tax=Aquimarina sp. BL5 TaxID=1714860 RepID=UPI000E4C4ACF|nr:5-oxoprolinase subunit PxpB [Aquimarina sp. BL5]AXT53618.1 5-oxoprolinase subunit PxpB [Aquimarina sp. BL5]RKM97623.1 5-oxoprolinase subunit PxpB [Aquimarina sp. BL5]